MDFVITKREIMVCIAITLVLLGLGFLISSSITNSIHESNEKYYKSLKITNDEETFKYALKTNIGYTLVQGKVKSNEKITHPAIKGEYYYIERIKEKYTRHTRQVAHTRTKSDGTTETYYTTEVYYTWDYAGREEWKTSSFNFSGADFSSDKIHFGNTRHLDTVKESSTVRYKYNVIPLEFDIVLFTNLKDNTITENEVYYSSTVAKVIEDKQGSGTWIVVCFWIVWIALIGFADFGFMYFENRYLED